MTDAARRELLFEAAKSIREAFVKYNDNFGRITRRAKQRFEARDWRGAERDFGERLELYTKSVERQVAALQRLFGPPSTTRELWPLLKQTFGARVDGIPDGAFSKTFFNSISRRIFQTVGTDPETEFHDIRFNIRDAQRHAVECRSYLNWGDLRELLRQLLNDCEFAVPYADFDGDITRIERDIERYAARDGSDADEVLRLDFLPAVFYQSARAYLIGKVFWDSREAPLVISLRHDDAGIAVDQIMMSVDDISILFGFTRSYFFADLEPVEGAVYFINSLLPHKPIDELYTVLGRVRQGKTERYRQFSNHLATCRDRFVHAPGDRGLVMICFTLPSYDLVFKVIRDRFGFPKNTSRHEVMEKYQFVFKHDRAGRLIDTQEFSDIGFPLDKFEQPVIDELLAEAAESARIEGDQVVLKHIYVERRLRPLNLFVREAPREAAEAAVIDYGQALRDLAHANIFPGDLLIKNFGVTRHGRCIFYDYDELCLVTDCNFRELPESPFEEDELRPNPWFHVNANDVFPEEFMRFLAIDEGLKQVFMARHADLLTVEFWRGVQQQHLTAQGSERRVPPHVQPRPRARPAFS